MKKFLVAFILALALMVSSAPAAEKRQTLPPDYSKVAPLVVIGGKTCLSIEYQIGEWVDENEDGRVQEAEWYVYINDTLEPGNRKEYYLPHGYYIIRVIVKLRNGEILEVGAEGPIPDPGLKPNEKVTLAIGCGKDFSKNGKDSQCSQRGLERHGPNAEVPSM